MSKPVMSSVDISDGETYTIVPGDHTREVCCECGLCHITVYEIGADGLIHATTHLDPYGTQKNRGTK